MPLLASASHLVARSIQSDVTSTAGSFKSWNTCMANHVCKIVAIVLIVIAALFLLWIVSTIVQIFCMGVTCLRALCCCCCRLGNRGYVREAPQNASPYNNSNMYPPNAAPMYRPQQAYTPMSQTEYKPANAYGRYSNDAFNEKPYQTHHF